MSTSAAAAAASSAAKICFNQKCEELRFDLSMIGWKLRTGEFAQLCDRCGSAYADGSFCEKYHTSAAGWRMCESCRKPLHCGCIVSSNSYVLLDAGGVECVACIRKHPTKVSNQSWSLVSPALAERCKDTLENCNPVAVPNGVSRQWWHTANARNVVTSQSELYSRMPYEVERSKAAEKLISTESPAVSGHERDLEDPSERAVPRSLGLSALDRPPNNNAGGEMVVALNAFHRQEGILDGLQHSAPLPGECGSADARKRVIDAPGTKTSVAGMSFDASSSHVSISLHSLSTKDPIISQHGMIPYSPLNETNGSTTHSGIESQQQTPPPSLSKQLHSSSQHGVDSSIEAQMRNGKARGDARGRHQLLPRYQPKITNEELQEISGDSNVVITPLFEKILSASDAGRIGRLVLPKRCAEAYFPTISHPEGVPLRVQDAKGHEWVFQFRFWPNNNSRMYVLEGVTPCIQNMQLQAGDTVTFSRKDPDGKLVMGFRKTSNAPPNQDNRKKNGNGVSKHSEANMKETNTWSEVDKSGYIAKDAFRAKPYPLSTKRKSSILGLKSKRLQIETEDLKRLRLTWDEAQELICSPLPPNNVPSVVVIEGHDFEAFQEEPVLGERNTVLTTNKSGSSHSSPTEPKDEQLQEQPSSNNVASKKNKSPQMDSDAVEGSEGLDTLANLALLGEAEGLPSAAQPPKEAEGLPSLAQPPTTKHPRHRAGCTCIVCIQPPSGKGLKHSDTCICNVCLTVKRRFRTLMERRGKRMSENEAGTSKKQQQQQQKPENVEQGNDEPNANCDLNEETTTNGITVDEPNHKNPSSPFKGGIDLNIQPEREEESSPVWGSDSMMRFTRDLPEEVHHKPDESNSSKNGGLDQADSSGVGRSFVGDDLGKGVPHESDSEEDDDDDEDYPTPLSVWIPPTTSTIDK